MDEVLSSPLSQIAEVENEHATQAGDDALQAPNTEALQNGFGKAGVLFDAFCTAVEQGENWHIFEQWQQLKSATAQAGFGVRAQISHSMQDYLLDAAERVPYTVLEQIHDFFDWNIHDHRLLHDDDLTVLIDHLNQRKLQNMVMPEFPEEKPKIRPELPYVGMEYMQMVASGQKWPANIYDLFSFGIGHAQREMVPETVKETFEAACKKKGIESDIGDTTIWRLLVWVALFCAAFKQWGATDEIMHFAERALKPLSTFLLGILVVLLSNFVYYGWIFAKAAMAVVSDRVFAHIPLVQEWHRDMFFVLMVAASALAYQQYYEQLHPQHYVLLGTLLALYILIVPQKMLSSTYHVYNGYFPCKIAVAVYCMMGAYVLCGSAWQIEPVLMLGMAWFLLCNWLMCYRFDWVAPGFRLLSGQTKDIGAVSVLSAALCLTLAWPCFIMHLTKRYYYHTPLLVMFVLHFAAPKTEPLWWFPISWLVLYGAICINSLLYKTTRIYTGYLPMFGSAQSPQRMWYLYAAIAWLVLSIVYIECVPYLVAWLGSLDALGVMGGVIPDTPQSITAMVVTLTSFFVLFVIVPLRVDAWATNRYVRQDRHRYDLNIFPPVVG